MREAVDPVMRRRVEDAERKARLRDREDYVVHDDRRLLIRSENGHYWSLTVGNDGTVNAVDTGTSL